MKPDFVSVVDRPAYRIGGTNLDNALPDLLTHFKSQRNWSLLQEAVHTFIRVATEARFETWDVATILKPYLDLGEESPLHYLEKEDLQDLFGFLGRLKRLDFWDDEDVIRFQTMVLTDTEKSGILEVFKSHTMYKRIVNGDEGPSITYHMEPIHDNNTPSPRPPIVTFRRAPAELMMMNYEADSETARDSSRDRMAGVMAIDDARSVIANSKENLIDICVNPYKVHNTIVYDFEEIEMTRVEPEYEGILYVTEIGTAPRETIDFGAMFHYLRAFRVDTKCTVVVSVGSLDLPNSWAKDIVACPGAWINFAEAMLPCNQLLLPVEVKILSHDPNDHDEVNICVMGVHLRRGPADALAESLTKVPPNLLRLGFRPYFTLSM